MEHIYVLVKDNEVVYVGKSKNVKQRMYGHKDKEYDFYEVIDSSDDKAKARMLEDYYIKNYDPIYNKRLNSSHPYKTIKQFVEENGLEGDELYEFMHSLILTGAKPLMYDKYCEMTLYRALKEYGRAGGRDCPPPYNFELYCKGLLLSTLNIQKMANGDE